MLKLKKKGGAAVQIYLGFAKYEDLMAEAKRERALKHLRKEKKEGRPKRAARFEEAVGLKT